MIWPHPKPQYQMPNLLLDSWRVYHFMIISERLGAIVLSAIASTTRTAINDLKL